MAMLYLSDLRNDVLVRLNQNTTITFYTNTIIGDFLNNAYKWVAGTHRWPQTDDRATTTWVSSQETWDFEGLKADSIRMLRVGDKRFQKTNFYDYQAFREDNTSAKDKIFSDWGMRVYINPNADVSGTLEVYAQFLPAPMDLTDENSTTVFSTSLEELNGAIVEETLYYCKQREKHLFPQGEADAHHAKAMQIIDQCWNAISGEQAQYQPKDSSMFKRLDVIGGATRDELIKRDQWY